MKLSFFRMNSICGFLTRTTITVLVLSQAVEAIAKTTPDSSQIPSLTLVQLDSPFEGISGRRYEQGFTGSLHPHKAGKVLLSSKPPVPPPVPKIPGARR